MDKETKHIKDQNVDTQGYSEHENTKIKTEYATIRWWTIQSKPHGQQRSALGQVKTTMHLKQNWKFRENKVQTYQQNRKA